ncbi:MAG: hypothetical protein DRN95_01390 [Candidatus Hydrothermarchaeota archaeon]|nr:MAG: hypothetical protein DRN95_01390 [Candidatus Hydrothermarchaeota archaeon]
MPNKDKIAVIGWGSLIWCPKGLKIRDKNWRENGPKLPIEFARISDDGRLTLVIYEKYLDNEKNWVQTCWNEMDVDCIDEAIENLREREGTRRELIGYIKQKEIEMKDGVKVIIYEKRYRSGFIKVLKVIQDWMVEHGLNGVVWTDLPANFKKIRGEEPNENSVIKYLEEIRDENGEKWEKAEEYILLTPEQITTPLRGEIEKWLKEQ